ncbi:helix-turn-helix domain-containing protein [Paenibacillaceae bacterium WGS1546]|uniref:helix-turn-helix domain-containing protein n=1 Tax=Cohnella sp. WGS1546 TaxID=3366810 RepID=UPI00372CF270
MNPKLPKSNKMFSYYPPHRDLSPYIAYYSIQHRFYPTIAPLFIPDLGGSIIVSHYQNELDIRVWGPFSQLTPMENRPYAALARYFIEFQPGGLSRLVYPNSNEVLNRKVALQEVDRNAYRSLRQLFEKHIHFEDDLISSLDHYFLGLLDQREDAFANGRHILNLMQEFGVNGSADQLSNSVHYSTRHINRYLNALTGISSKGYIRIKRCNKAVEMLKKSNCSIEQIAFKLGYYDAAHFVHDFAKLSGVSPTLYRKNKSGFYNEALKRL